MAYDFPRLLLFQTKPTTNNIIFLDLTFLSETTRASDRHYHGCWSIASDDPLFSYKSEAETIAIFGRC